MWPPPLIRCIKQGGWWISYRPQGFCSLDLYYLFKKKQHTPGIIQASPKPRTGLEGIPIVWVWGMFQVYVEKILYINALTIDSAMTVCLPERFSFSTHSIHLRLVLHTILCLFPDSLCLLGPCCSSWGIPCRYTTMRSYINANGATHLPFVAEANQTIGLSLGAYTSCHL